MILVSRAYSAGPAIELTAISAIISN